MSSLPVSDRVTGRISVHPRGFGFLTVQLETPGELLSAFIPPPELNPFLADDLVSATVSRGADGRWTATGLELVERHREQLFGEVVRRRGGLWLRADREVANTDWPLETDERSRGPVRSGLDADDRSRVREGAALEAGDGSRVREGAAVEAGRLRLAPGDWVLARIDGPRLVPVRKVDAEADVALEQVIARHGLRREFDAGVLEEARAAMTRPHPLGARRDLRGVPTVTVDAASTKDIDDAISVLPAGPDGAVRLLVSIADVAEFVTEGSRLDREARDRATSTYLAGQVLTMLPEALSNGWLSLLPGEERSCLTVELRVDPEGRIAATDVYESLIRSWARLDYTEVAEYLDHNRISPAMAPVAEAMPWFRTAAARIALARARRGGMEIARDETRIVFDTRTGEPAGVESVAPTSAHAMIERFMVAANEAIAAWLVDRGVPAMYRVHDQPDRQRIDDLAAAAHHFGFEPGFGRALTPLALAAFDLQITGAASEPALRSVLLRSLGPARYTVVPSIHFGLAAPLYLHFTSPIRRYADLTVHRILKAYLRGRRDFVPDDPAIEALAQHVNHRARVASRAENDRRRVLVARLMAAHVGEVFDARITRVRPFGLIAQIDATLVEGTVPLESLPEGPYQPDARETALVGPAHTFAIGMAVRVRVMGTDPMLGRVELGIEGSS